MSLSVANLTKRFGEKVAVDHLSLSMDAPGVYGLIGTNGAGKTTSIRMMLGILGCDEGEARWDGKPITRETLAFGYMPEERGIYMRTKVLEQLVYFGMLRGMGRSAARESAITLLKRLDMYDKRDMAAEKLSKGNQQKVQLIATLVHDPKLLVLDEPFSGLDPVNVEMLQNLIGELVDEGKYIVMSSHEMATVEAYCTDLTLLHEGKSVLSGNLAKIKAGYGHTNLVVSGAGDFDAAASKAGLALLEKRSNETEYKISGDDMADAFLRALLAGGARITKFEIREPSLREIFLEKVAGAQ